MSTPLASMSGLDLLRSAISRLDEVPGIGQLLGMQLDSAEEGEVVFSLNTRPDFANVAGAVHGGIYAALLDSAMGCAVHSTLEPGVGYSTLELKVNLTRGVPTGGARLVGTGRTLHVGRRTATAEGEIRDAEGRLVAHGTTTCLIDR